MTPPLEEHDYIGLSEVSSNGSTSTNSSSSNYVISHDERSTNKLTSLKQTELRLGLPGSDSPYRVSGSGLTLGISISSSGSKRGFSDALDGSPKWVFNGGVVNGSKSELFSPRKGDNTPAAAAGVKDGDKKPHSNPAPAAKAQVVGWPPIRNSRKNIMATNSNANNGHGKDKEDADAKQGSVCLYVKVSMDGAPYLRKVDLKTYFNYKDLSRALEKMFSGFTIGQCGSHGLAGRDGVSDSRVADLVNGSENVLTYEDKDGDWMLVGDVPWDSKGGSGEDQEPELIV